MWVSALAHCHKRFEGSMPKYHKDPSGGIGCFDGTKPFKAAGLMSRALLYTKNFNGLIFSFPYDSSLSPKGQMNESLESTKLGLEGIPALAEELHLSRDLFLTSYNNAKIHFASISTESSVAMLLDCLLYTSPSPRD